MLILSDKDPQILLILKKSESERKWKWSSSVLSDSLWLHGLWLTRLFCLWDSPGKNTGVGCHFLLQIFPTQGLNLGLPHCRQTLYCLSRSPTEKVFNKYTSADWSIFITRLSRILEKKTKQKKPTMEERFIASITARNYLMHKVTQGIVIYLTCKWNLEMLDLKYTNNIDHYWEDDNGFP